MRNIKLTIEYDGTNYSGWQSQEDEITVQETIERAIEISLGEKVRITGSGRTDAKVHALGQVANFYTNTTIPTYKIKYILNNILPEDISILDSEEVELTFHSRFSAKGKRYKYQIYNGKIGRPIYRNISYHVKHEIDIERMKEASKYLIGTYDFASFMSRKAVVHTTVRTIYNIEINKQEEFIEITIEGNNFLRNMVRIMVGTLVKIGTWKMNPEEMHKILLERNRCAAGPTAPPQGLFLEEVFYEY